MNAKPQIKQFHEKYDRTQFVKDVFDYNPKIKNQLNKAKSARLGFDLNSWDIIKNEFKIGNFFESMEEIFFIEYSGSKKEKSEIKLDPNCKKDRIGINKVTHLSAETIRQISAFKGWLLKKRYSENTIKTYIDAFQTFLQYFNYKSTTEITYSDLLQFKEEYILHKGYSSSYQNQVVNALKLFLMKIDNRIIDVEQIDRPRKEYKLPNVLSKEEVKSILNAPLNLKHRTMLCLIYSCGLRRSELLNLKPEDIASRRWLMFIIHSKGNKDRRGPISDNLIVMLQEYDIAFNLGSWIFEGQVKVDQYSATCFQQVSKYLKQT